MGIFDRERDVRDGIDEMFDWNKDGKIDAGEEEARYMFMEGFRNKNGGVDDEDEDGDDGILDGTYDEDGDEYDGYSDNEDDD